MECGARQDDEPDHADGLCGGRRWRKRTIDMSR
jgi:hypothetical protein